MMSCLVGLVTYRGGPKTVTHPSTNRAERRVTSFMRRTTLPLYGLYVSWYRSKLRWLWIRFYRATPC